MADGKFVLAKTYIIYRYSRELIRKANTTDDLILSLIQNRNKDVMEENSNKNATVASTQRDLIAGEVSKDLTKRMLLPEKISRLMRRAPSTSTTQIISSSLYSTAALSTLGICLTTAQS